MNTKIALVTGGNKGIGFEVARELGAKNFRVFLGARNEAAGRKAEDALKKDGAAVEFIRLDVDDPQGIAAAAREFATKADHLDVLVNNAGVLLDRESTIQDISVDILEQTLRTNTWGPLRVAQAFIPFLEKSNAPRIVNVSSESGQLTRKYTAWAPAYSISKTALNAVTSQLAGALPKFAVNSICPGWVRTDMGGPGAHRSVEQGADTIVWLATEAPQSLTGQFLRDRKPFAW
jgi:NAD(P)-dependent dehydrogenase (short-subunit alcohol dehydrogenase family)